MCTALSHGRRPGPRRPLPATAPRSPSPGVILMFVTTLSSMLVKDLILLGAAVWTTGESLDVASARKRAR